MNLTLLNVCVSLPTPVEDTRKNGWRKDFLSDLVIHIFVDWPLIQLHECV